MSNSGPLEAVSDDYKKELVLKMERIRIFFIKKRIPQLHLKIGRQQFIILPILTTLAHRYLQNDTHCKINFRASQKLFQYLVRQNPRLNTMHIPCHTFECRPQFVSLILFVHHSKKHAFVNPDFHDFKSILLVCVQQICSLTPNLKQNLKGNFNRVLITLIDICFQFFLSY